jgi:protein-tyrosine kinase
MGSSGANPGAKPGQPAVVCFSRPRSPAAEAYRTLRTNLEHVPGEGPRRRLLLTSAGPDEGKSTAVANLAVTMAQAGTRVVVVDGDLRRPAQHTLFNLRDSPGLTNLLLSPAGGEGGGAELPLQPTAVEGLWLLASGPLAPNPAELLGSTRMEEVLTRLAGRTDVILIDSAPVVPFADAAALSRRADGVLLVVGAGTVKRDLARKAQTQLEAVGAPVVGVVVLNVDFDAGAFDSYFESEGAAPHGAAPPSR